jgi:hypothetical protein
MLIDQDGIVWDRIRFDREDDLEALVLLHYRHFYGERSLLFGKTLIKTLGGSGTIPDAFAVNVETRTWYVVEIELLRHGISHIAPQIATQVMAASNARAQGKLQRLFVRAVQANPDYIASFRDAGVQDIEISALLAEILSEEPVVSIPIDDIDEDLLGWKDQQSFEIRLQKIQAFGNRQDDRIILHAPDHGASRSNGSTNGAKPSSLRGAQLLTALLDHGLLTDGERLTMEYSGISFPAVVTAGGLRLDTGEVLSPSEAGCRCARTLNPGYTAMNGLAKWRNASGETLESLREALQARKKIV